MHVCPECGKEFSFRTNLTRHRKAHNITSPFQCELCPKTFARSDALRRHAATHSKPKKAVSVRAQPSEAQRNRNRATLLEQLPQPDPTEPTDEIRQQLEARWPDEAVEEIVTNFNRVRTTELMRGRVLTELNVRVTEADELIPLLKKCTKLLHQSQKYKYYLNFRFGYALINHSVVSTRELGLEPEASEDSGYEDDGDEDRAYAFYYSSNNTNFFIGDPPLITTDKSLDHVLSILDVADLIDWASSMRPDSKFSFYGFTNFTIRLISHRGHPIRGPTSLPPYLRNNKFIYTLTTNKNSGIAYEDDKCLFRCLALAKGWTRTNLETPTDDFQRKWCEARNSQIIDFRGVTFEDLYDFDRLLSAKTDVWEYQLTEAAQKKLPTRESEGRGENLVSDLGLEDAEGGDDLEDQIAETEALAQDSDNYGLVLIHKSENESSDATELNVVLHADHFCFITDVDCCTKSFQCPKCSYLFDHRGHYNRHLNVCKGGDGVPTQFPGGGFTMRRSLFEGLEEFEVTVPEGMRYKEYFGVFDYESNEEEIHEKRTESLEFTGKLHPATYSISANVPGYETAKCDISTGDESALVEQMIAKLEILQRKSQEVNEAKYKVFISETERKLVELEVLIRNARDEHFRRYFGRMHDELTRLMELFQEWLAHLPVFTFNGGSFDINLIKQYLFPLLVRSKKFRSVIKRNNSYMAVAMKNITMLDIRNYLAANTSYEQMLKAFGVPFSKFSWPYRWFRRLDQLDETEIPDIKYFNDNIRGKKMTQEKYQSIREEWKKRRWKTMRDFIKFYNNADTFPFVLAIIKMIAWWRMFKIDLLSDGISLPSLALRHLYNSIKAGYYFPLINENNADLHWLMRQNIVGGPSLVFRRFHEKGVTRIRDGNNFCQKILGLDCNALYLWCTMQRLPVNVYFRWLTTDNKTFVKRNMYPYSQKELQWLTWLEQERNIKIQHKFNGGQRDFGCGGCGEFKYIPVDGYCAAKKTIFQFAGCHVHGHGCRLDNNPDSESRKSHTRRITKYLRQLGYAVETIYECAFDRLAKNKKSSLHALIKERFTTHFEGRGTADKKEILKAIKNGKFFGMCEVDIMTPDHLKDRFAEMQPLFKNTEISRDNLTGEITRYAESDQSFLRRPRRTLIGSYFADKMLIITPLLKWYLEQGLVVTKLHQAFEAVGSAQFVDVGESVCEARRLADRDPSEKMKGEMSKTVGNCFYGKTITDIMKHREVVFVNDRSVDRYLRDPRFQDLNQIAPDTYEVSLRKRKHVFRMPYMIGYWVYQYAKLRLLDFHHSFVDRFIPRDCYELLQCDTDSLYMGISGDTLEGLVPKTLKCDFEQEKDKWLPRTDTVENAAYDKRKPGLFKVEYEGLGMICLASKLYFGWTSDEGKTKVACKGVHHWDACITKANFQLALDKGKTTTGVNKGFKLSENVLKFYVQKKTAISPLYIKRPLLRDSYRTGPCLL